MSILTISHILPLDFLISLTCIKPASSVYVLEFVCHITRPSNVFLDDVDFRLSTVVLLIQLESVIEETLGNEATRGSWKLVVVEWDSFSLIVLLELELLVWPEVSNLDDWVACVLDIIYAQVVSSQLRIVSRFHISSMVLVEIVKLVVDVDWSLDFRINGLKWYFTVLISLNF